MKKNILLAAISFLAIISPLPGVGSADERAGALPDLWVYRGCYAWFDGGRASLEGSGIEELRAEFLQSADCELINAEHPLTGRIEARDIFILDGTELYFEDASLPSGGVYGFCGVSVMSGSLSVSAVSAAGDVFVAPGAALMSDGEINAGGAVECFGGRLSAGGINAGSIWLDSAEAPLDVTVAGSVFTGFYTQSGGSVTIGGGLYCSVYTEYDGALITVNGEYARYNPARLAVSGDVVAMGDCGGIEVGGGSGVGGRDEAALRAFEAERSSKKTERRGAYEATPPVSEVTLTIGGELRSSGTAVFFDESGERREVLAGDPAENNTNPQ